MPWWETPTHGSVLGQLHASDSTRVDGAVVKMRRSGWFPFRRSKKVIADGNGYFGFPVVKPGKYTVSVDLSKLRATVEIRPGAVTRTEFEAVR